MRLQSNLQMEFWDQIDSQLLQQFRSHCIWIDGGRNEPNKSQLIIQQLSVVSSKINAFLLLQIYKCCLGWSTYLPFSKYNFLTGIRATRSGMVDQYQI